MLFSEADRQAAKAVRDDKTPMPWAARAALGRGKCADCNMPWDCVETRGHIAVPGGLDWLCSGCFLIPVLRAKYFTPAKLSNRQLLRSKRALFSMRYRRAVLGQVDPKSRN
jgi:hypothetical protein